MPKRAKFTPTRSGTPEHPWRVNVPANLSESGRRERRFFSTKREAETFAETEKNRIENFGSSTSGLTPAQREAAATAFRLLENSPTSQLVAIVEEHLAREQERTASVTLKQLQQEFTDAKSQRSQAYRRQIRQSFSRLSSLSELKVSTIGPLDIDNSLKGLADTNRNLQLRVLRAAFNLAVKKGWATKNPVARLDFALESRGEVEVLTNRQVMRLLVATRRIDPELLPYNLFGLFAGIRPEELTRMKWEDVRLDEQHIVLPKE